jgi:hypothetical protein
MSVSRQKATLYYHEVLEAMPVPDCPACARAEAMLKKYFEVFIGDGINSVDFALKFREEYGFCNHHTYQFLSFRDTTAITFTHKDLLDFQLKDVRKNAPVDKRLTKCYVCEMALESEELTLGVFANFVDDAEMKEAYLKSDGFCIPHYRRLQETMKRVPEWVMEFQERKWTELSALAGKYLDFCNGSLGDRRPVLNEEEKVVWKKLTRYVQGYEGLPVRER